MKQDTLCKIKCDYHCLLRMSMTTAVPRKHSSFYPRWHGGTSCIIILSINTLTARLDGRNLEHDTRKNTA